MLKSHQRGDLTPAETKVDYLHFAKVLPRFCQGSLQRKKCIQAFRCTEWKHFTIMELNEWKCACYTSEEKTQETI